MSLRMPNAYTASEIVRWPNSEYVNLKWRPSRPCAFGSLFHEPRRRFKLAWRVFTGRYDALNWEGASGEINAPFTDCTRTGWINATEVYPTENSTW